MRPFTTTIRRGTACVFACMVVLSNDGLAQEAAERSTEDTLGTIERLEGMIGKTELSPDRRSTALDEAIEIRDGLIRNEPDDPRRPTWHADQAEDLLLKRIEFPNSWTRHLLNADPACPIMPPEIPLIVARGLEEAILAGRTAAALIDQLETNPKEDFDHDTANLMARLRFERDVRAPLLEAIGLVLASGLDPGAAAKAAELLEVQAEHDDAQIRSVVDRWLRLAVIESEDRERMRSGGWTIEDIEDDHDRIRAMMRMGSPRAAASLAARRHQMEPDTNHYQQLLFADLRERALELELDDADGWTAEHGDLWITMLDESGGGSNGTFDAALVPRLTALAGRLGEDSMPLAAAWALAEEELSLREVGGHEPSDEARERLARILPECPVDDPAHARALSVTARLAMADGDRIGAARALETLYLRHPDAPGADPGRVVDLLEPALGLERPWILESYERALRSSSERATSTPEEEEQRVLRLVALAEHLSRNERRADALEMLEALRTDSPSTAARALVNRGRIVHEMLEAEELEDPEARRKHREIASDHRSLTVRHGKANPALHVSGALTALDAVRTRMSGRITSPEDVRAIESICRDERLEPSTRIRGFVIRHQLRAMSSSGRTEARETAPDLLEALRIDETVGRDILIESALEIMELIEAERRLGNHLEADRIGSDRLRPFAFAFESGTPPSPNIIDRISIARILLEGGRPRSALDAWNNLEQEHPGALEVLVGRADALWALGGEESLADAMRIYRKLGRGEPGSMVPEATWWEAQLRQLLILEKVGRSLDRITPRIERLRLKDPTFGGPRHQAAFESLRTRLLSD
jgi:hypothetical protein